MSIYSEPRGRDERTPEPRPGQNNTPQKRIERENRIIDQLCSEMMDIVHKAVKEGKKISDFHAVFFPMEFEDFGHSRNPLALLVREVFDRYVEDQEFEPHFREAYRKLQLQIEEEFASEMGIRHKLRKWLS